MMQLLAKITKYAIEKEYITYDELYSYNEEDLFNLFKEKEDKELKSLIYNFENVPKEEIPYTELQNVKMRKLNPIVDGKRI